MKNRGLDDIFVAGEVAGHYHALRLSLADSPSHLDHQRDRVGQQRNPQTDPQPKDLSKRKFGSEDNVHGNPRGVKEVDNAGPQLEIGPKPLRDLVRGPAANQPQLIAFQSAPDTKICTGP